MSPLKSEGGLFKGDRKVDVLCLTNKKPCLIVKCLNLNLYVNSVNRITLYFLDI